MTKRKPKDTGARADVVESLKRMRAWLAEHDSADVYAAWCNSRLYDPCAGMLFLDRDTRRRLIAFVLRCYPRSLYTLSAISTPAYSLRWLDTVIAHDTAELKARGVL